MTENVNVDNGTAAAVQNPAVADESHVSRDKHDFPIVPGCVVQTEDNLCDSQVLLVTDVKGHSLIGLLLAGWNEDSEKHDPTLVGTGSAQCADCIVLVDNLAEAAQTFNLLMIPGSFIDGAVNPHEAIDRLREVIATVECDVSLLTDNNTAVRIDANGGDCIKTAQLLARQLAELDYDARIERLA